MCDRTAHIKTQIVDESLKSKWHEAIPDFYEKNLLINGWLRNGSGTHADAVSQLGMLLDKPEARSGISFSNKQDEATCSISFTHRRPEAGGETTLAIYAKCQRWIKVFGGFPEHLIP